MCRLQFQKYECGHSDCIIIGTACPGAKSPDSSGVPYHCIMRFKVQRICSPNSCRKRSFLVDCHQLQRLDATQLRMLQLCDERALQIKVHMLRITRRIVVALAKLSHGEFDLYSHTDGEQPEWQGASTADYPDLETMMKAAWATKTQSEILLSAAFSLCTSHILCGFRQHQNYEAIVHNSQMAGHLASVLLLPVEAWLQESFLTLEAVAQGLESLVEAGLQSGDVSGIVDGSATRELQATIDGIDESISLFTGQ